MRSRPPQALVVKSLMIFLITRKAERRAETRFHSSLTALASENLTPKPGLVSFHQRPSSPNSLQIKLMKRGSLLGTTRSRTPNRGPGRRARGIELEHRGWVRHSQYHSVFSTKQHSPAGLGRLQPLLKEPNAPFMEQFRIKLSVSPSLLSLKISPLSCSPVHRTAPT